MDQIKIGKFIAQCRKDQGLTQLQLAEKLGITDRAVSKWETGKSMPDVGMIPELCRELNITVNDLLSGEKVSTEQYGQKLEAQLLELVGEKEVSDKRSLRLGRLIMILAAVLELAFLCISDLAWQKYNLMANIASYLAFGSLLLIFIYARMDQNIGFFRCSHCGHTYTPRYWSLSFGRGGLYRRHIRCPECKEKCWHQRVYTKPENKEDCV